MNERKWIDIEPKESSLSAYEVSKNPLNHQNLRQQYIERIERLSQQDRVSKFCMDAGFINVVEIGQYFMTKDTGKQFYAKACREYTLPKR